MTRILLIEDDNFLAEDIKYFIEKHGNTCIHSRDADQAMSNISNNNYDAVILDLMMRKGVAFQNSDSKLSSGELLFREIRKISPLKKILVVTAKNMDEIFDEIINDDFTKIIIKPVMDLEESLTEYFN